jgi:hypothetical protein
LNEIIAFSKSSPNDLCLDEKTTKLRMYRIANRDNKVGIPSPLGPRNLRPKQLGMAGGS